MKALFLLRNFHIVCTCILLENSAFENTFTNDTAMNIYPRSNGVLTLIT